MKKGQAAMEFLMTYGWAILTVLIAIAALAYFGVLNPGKYVPSSCVLAPGLGCNDFKVTHEKIILVIRNGMGQDLIPFNVTIGGDCNGSTQISEFIDGEEKIFTINCTPNGILGSKIKESIIVQYTSENEISHTKIGAISSRVE